MTTSETKSGFSLKIAHRLYGGFAIVVLLMIAAISTTLFQVSGIKQTTDRIVDLRTPTALTSSTLTTEIQASLAALRGYMLTGAEQFQAERAHVWDDIEHSQAEMDVLSSNWTNSANIEVWSEFKAVMEEFRIAQAQVEKIAHSVDEQPAVKMLVEDAAPRAAAMVATITSMIDHEVHHDGTANLSGDRVQILGMMADIRGSLGLALANIRAYLLTGDEIFVEKFDALWAKNDKRFADLQKVTHLLTPDQKSDFAEFSTIRDEFALIPPQMFEIRSSDKWNMANYTLITEAAPKAGRLLTILLGPKDEADERHGGMVDNQRGLLNADSAAGAASTSALLVMQWVLLALGVIFGGAIAFMTSRALATPIVAMTEAMDKLAGGDLDVEIPAQNRADEIGDMAGAVQVFKDNAIEVARMNDEEQQRAGQTRERTQAMTSLVTSLGSVVDAAVGGDFSQRIDVQLKDEDLQGVATGVNNLVDTVDRGVTETGEVLSALANTDLTQRMSGDYKGAFAKLKDDTNLVADKLTDIVSQLRGTSGGLKTATGEILAGANDLSERTTKQAATIEETSAAMEQLATTVTESAKKAEEAAGKSLAVARTAEEGGEVMNHANSAMERITTSSEKISNIIGMIDDIAFQTNLLALNASVEAARAGEAGKGFAVVAIEVRRLAQSAAEASSEVKALVEQSASEVGEGSKLVTEAAAKLSSMLDDIQQNSSLMESIAAESREQASSIDEVNTAVRLMDEMTQHNAALVEQTNAAIEQTEAQANELDQIVDVFKLNEGETSQVSRSQPQARPTAEIKKMPVKAAAKAYLSNGNAAIDQDWAEF